MHKTLSAAAAAKSLKNAKNVRQTMAGRMEAQCSWRSSQCSPAPNWVLVPVINSEVDAPEIAAATAPEVQTKIHGLDRARQTRYETRDEALQSFSMPKNTARHNEDVSSRRWSKSRPSPEIGGSRVKWRVLSHHGDLAPTNWEVKTKIVSWMHAFTSTSKPQVGKIRSDTDRS